MTTIGGNLPSLLLRRIMENHAQAVALARMEAADAMFHVDPINASGALNGAMTHRENDRIALIEIGFISDRIPGLRN
jgi:hypothetical protein